MSTSEETRTMTIKDETYAIADQDIKCPKCGSHSIVIDSSINKYKCIKCKTIFT